MQKKTTIILIVSNEVKM